MNFNEFDVTASPGLTGTYERHLPDGRQTNRYHYDVVRLWQDDPEGYLTGGIAMVPLAPLTAVSEAELPGVIRRMQERINREPERRAAKLWTATCLLMGLRYSDDLVMSLLEGVQGMHQSSTYERILREGRNLGEITEAQRFLQRLGTRRFGVPSPACIAALEAITDVDRVEALGDRILEPDIKTWDELLRGS